MPAKVEKDIEGLEIVRVCYNFVPSAGANISPWGDYYTVGQYFPHPTGGGLVQCTRIREDKREGVVCVKVWFDDGSVIKQYNINQIWWSPPKEDEDTPKTDNKAPIDPRLKEALGLSK